MSKNEIAATPVKDAQRNIAGTEVAHMIMEFWDEFRNVYGKDVTESSLCAVGPLQSMIGLAVKNGHLILAVNGIPLNNPYNRPSRSELNHD